MVADRGFDAIDADSIGHRVIAQGGPAHAEVAMRWPTTVVDGEVDRAALARIVFEDEDELRGLEAITHPHIFGMIQHHVEGIDGRSSWRYSRAI